MDQLNLREVGNEIIFASISPIGIDTNLFQTHLENILREYNYELEPIKISNNIRGFIDEDKLETDEYKRKIQLIEKGNELRQKFGPSILADLAISIISKNRESSSETKVGSRRAFYINGIKHFEEIDRLRSLYGTSFFLIGINSSFDSRRKHLINQKNVSPENFEDLVKRDQDDLKYGQKLYESFYRADVFIPFDTDKQMNIELRRFIDLIFGYPYHTPRIDEHMMFQAYAASLRSADLSRQVGAVISTEDGDLLSSGANDVPKFGGGQYWAEDRSGKDDRDYVRKYDSNKKKKNEIIGSIVNHIIANQEVVDQIPAEKITIFSELLKKIIAKSDIKSITEYGRAVHAEMAAITTAARLGISAKMAILYTTTFPCHNCAKHIIASGIKKVIYVEPYPKSMAFVLHGDAASSSDKENSENTVKFEPFNGIGPRRFFDLFSMTLSNGDDLIRSESGETIDFEKNKSTVLPRIRMNMASIIDQEKRFTLYIQQKLQGDSND